MHPTLRKISATLPYNYPTPLRISDKMYNYISSARLTTLLTWWLVASQLFLIFMDITGGTTTPLLTIALLNIAAICTFLLSFCFDVIIFLLPVLVSSGLTALFLWYRVAEFVQFFNKAGPTSAKWI
ncbi:hypothetical protein F5X68DRAFT_232647 [Plectosphaerella plurivora]|uniref:Uncharacterized protein n=1 Tax=Plectosphaerella plurivora TaxID=936078 RepID=A0A9P8V9U7_9PEZI|nr:hypothetical protein F5X68DRAFT_232647 [Plectosphaerella plurivora]